MEYLFYGIGILAAVLFAGYLGGLRAAQLIADHEEEKHNRTGPPPPNHVNCRSQLPPEFFNMPDGDVKSKEEIELMLQEAGKEKPKIIRIPVDEDDIKGQIRLLKDRIKGLEVKLQGQYDRLFKYMNHRLEMIEDELEDLEIKENVDPELRKTYAENAKQFYGKGENKNL